ncbi:ABC transporter permease [Nocardia cyriacigeorgica]|uniref:ABC transporter permease n=1 Tax=Nocardia cyriacigeorgica TaxID=135487 RepID=A0A6P1CG66_9NOCA|nr:ABC transporter permease [Nocardia cyriacigeorgica]MBF6084406.1 ABC transporter permease [Nocardia cyriacigeorgica]MBF6286930.1 ABC transporter permease [Nocardia cyriacigeorgica]NEW31388.1 ABC transporter permease [Nocardia cyriacigeorgica]BDT89985.1 putative YrbE family protein [Nocardia cyriacigeorgica]BDU09377.1 putative YrbE family protein [Nocardia cyriacigeorgica]
MQSTKSPPAGSRLSDAVEWTKDYWRDHPKKSLETLGRQMTMGAQAVTELVVAIFRRRFPFDEFIRQCAFMASVAAAPTLLVAIPIGVIVSIQVGAVASQVGATSFIGAANGLGIIQQGAPLVTVLMIAGAVGSAICADLGSRTIREEIDAMKVMGVDPMRRLVAPRLGAAMIVSVLLCGFVVFVGFLTGYIFNIFAQGGTPGSYIATFSSFAVTLDLLVALIKSLLFGLLAAIIACDTGLNTRGGPGGVANSVNTAVVMSAVMLFGVNVIFTQVYNTLFPPTVV